MRPDTKWRLANPDKHREIARKSMRKTRLISYGFTEDSFQKKWDEQNGLCALPSCGKSIEVPDHDHKTGKPRGLLCRNHNLGLGFFGDSIALLREAAKYLKSFKEKL